MSIEVMKQALEALKHEANRGNDNAYQSERDALRAAIEQAEKQEPFGYFKYAPHFDAWVQNRDSNEGVAFYTAPQRVCSGCDKTNNSDSMWAVYCVDCWEKTEEKNRE